MTDTRRRCQDVHEASAGSHASGVGPRAKALASWVGMVLLVCGAIQAHAGSEEAGRLNESAVALTAQGRYAEAATLFAQALRLSPDDDIIRRNLARVRTVLGHRLLQARSLQAAQEQYRAALELVPDESAALLGLGDTQLQQREPRAAVASYQRAVTLEPRNPEVYRRLGEAYYQQGDMAAALSTWERALSLRPEDGQLRQRIEAVQKESRVQAGYRVRGSQHFTVLYEGQRREDLGGQLLDILEHAYADIGYELGAYPPYEVQVIFYSNEDFVSATGFSTGMGGFYHRLDGKIRIALKGLTPGDPTLKSVMYHEYTHALIYAITRGNNPPRWVHEGLAVQLEKWRAPAFKQEAVRQARAGNLPLLDASPYTHGATAVGHLIDRYGMASIRHLLQRLGDGRPFAEAFQETFQRDLGTFQQEYRDLLVRGN